MSEEIKLSRCVGGIGEKKSNGGSQYYQQDRIYLMGDVCLALPAQLPYGSYNYLEIKKLEDIKQLGKLEEGSSQRRIVYDSEYSSPTLQAAMGSGGGNVPLVVDAVIGPMQENAMVGNGEYSPSLTEAMGMGGGQIPMVVEKSSVVVQKCGDRDKEGSYSVHDYSNTIPANPMSDRGQMLVEQTCVAMRGRNPENPSDRTKGIKLEQKLEPNSQGLCNTLTSVQKDNLVLEKQKVEVPKKIKIRQATKQGFIECEIGGGGGLGLSIKSNSESKGNRGREIESHADDGEYP